VFERESRRVRGMEHRILIVGAGISGLTLGALLHQRGFRNVVIIEKATEYRRDGYVLSMFSLARDQDISLSLVALGTHSPIRNAPTTSARYILGLWGNGLRILKGLGLYEQVIEMGSQINQFVVMKHDASKLTSFSLDRVTERYDSPRQAAPFSIHARPPTENEQMNEGSNGALVVMVLTIRMVGMV